jgi:hypothetical protein
MIRLLDMTISFQCGDGYRPPPYDHRSDLQAIYWAMTPTFGRKMQIAFDWLMSAFSFPRISPRYRWKERSGEEAMNKPILPRNAVVPGMRRT